MEEGFCALVEYIRGQLVLGLMTREAAMSQLVERLKRDNVTDPLAQVAGIMQAVALERLVGANAEMFVPWPRSLALPRSYLARPNHAHRTAPNLRGWWYCLDWTIMLKRLVVLPEISEVRGSFTHPAHLQGSRCSGI